MADCWPGGQGAVSTWIKATGLAERSRRKLGAGGVDLVAGTYVAVQVRARRSGL